MSADPASIDPPPRAVSSARRSSELIIDPPGRVAWVSEAVQRAIEHAHDLAEYLAADHLALVRVGGATGSAANPLVARALANADAECAHAAAIARAAAERARNFARRLELVAAAYASADESADRAARTAAAAVAWWLGAGGVIPVTALALALTPSVLLAFALTGVPPSDVPEAVGAWLVDHPEVLTDPRVVDAVRLIAASSDDALAGVARVPLPASLVLGDDGLSVTGAATGASAVIAAGRGVGLFRESGVRVTRVEAPGAPLGPARGMEERLGYVPEGDQIRIQRIEAPGLPPRWEVFIGPTESFDPVARSEPFDLTSNVAAVAGGSGAGSAASLRAVELALNDAGVSPTDEVQFTGYSQGGIIAARMAESGHWNTVAVTTFGSPLGTIEVPQGLGGIAVSHTDDLVPALGGPGDPPLLGIQRRAFPEGSELPDAPLPAHQRFSYRETAVAIDNSRSQLVREEVHRLDAFAGDYLAAGGSVETFTYHADRVPTVPGGSAPSGSLPGGKRAQAAGIAPLSSLSE